MKQLKTRRLLSSYLKLIFDYLPELFSGTCLLCGTRSHSTLDLCELCNKDLPYLGEACTRCALPLSGDSARLSHSCAEESFPFNYHVFSTFVYQFPINRLITALKFKHRLVVSTVLGELMAKKMHEVYQERPVPTTIIPIPLHSTRLRQRGFNQALELARPISRALSIPLEYRSCCRTQLTQPQANLAARDRASNVEDAFTVSTSFKGRSICLIDDVYTTGSTAMALSKALFEAGAYSVEVWCCARTLLL